MTPWFDALSTDARYAVRALRRSPRFAAIATLTLAVGIGASTAVFSVVDPLLFRPLPYPRGDRLVSVGFSGPIDTVEFMVSDSYMDWRDHQTAFQSLTSMYPGGQCDLGAEPPARIECYQVESNFLSTLGIVPVLGRNIRPEDDQAGAPKIALLGYGLWRSRFGGDPNVVGRMVDLDGGAVRVAGVLPATFEMPQLGQADVLLPEQMARPRNSTIFLRTFARLKDGIDVEGARQRMLPLFQESVQKDVPPSLRKEVRLVVRSLRDRQIHDARVASWLLFGAVLALMALACANVTNLMLARSATRRGELAMRAALGAGRIRLIRQMMAETLVLSLLGAAAACAFAAALLRALVAIAPQALLRVNQAHIDARVFCFAVAVSLLAAVFTGLLPAREQLSVHALSGWRTAGAAGSGSRQILVGVQIAISLVLLSGASLLVRSLWKLEIQPLGFRPGRVMTASFTLNRQRYGSVQAPDAFYSELERQLARIPGVSQVAVSDTLPPGGAMHSRPFSNLRIAGHPPLPQNGGLVAFRYVTPGYFHALGIPILAGRDFEQRERSAADTPLILSATLARRMFGGENPIGQQIDLEESGHWLPVVGVVDDVKNSGLAQAPDPEYYRLRIHNSPQLGRSAAVLFETGLDEATATRWVKQQVAGIDASLPVKVETMRQRVGSLSERPRFIAALVGLFAGFGVFVAAIGIYGVLSFLVAQRTREIGVRIAMGATPSKIVRMIEKQAGIWALGGIAVGLVASAGAARLARGLLFQVSPYDPFSVAVSIAVLSFVAALAAWWPARRASTVDPAVSLRQE